MIPVGVVVVDAVPLTQNGKVDRGALAALGGERRRFQAPYEPPRNEVEQALAEIWAEVLGSDRVGLDDNFFVLGGDSIRSIQVCYRAQGRGLDFSTRELFSNPTVRSLAPQVRAGLGEPEALLDKVDEMSGEEVESLLEALMAEQGARG